MALINCQNCGTVFVGDSGLLCPKCSAEDEKSFNQLKKYLAENPDVSAEKAAEAVGVDIKVILRLLRNGRLEVKRPKGEASCLGCGISISSGFYCPQCSADQKRKSSGPPPGKGVAPQEKKDPSDALKPVRKTEKGQIHSRRIRRKSGK